MAKFIYGTFVLLSIVSSLQAQSNSGNSPDDETHRPITVRQHFANDNLFRGFSALGNKLSHRDNMRLDSIPQTWNLTTGVIYQPNDNFYVEMNVMSPTAHRRNRDSDFFFQSAPGDKQDFSQSYLDSAFSGNLNGFINDALTRDRTNPRDPSSIRLREERNGLKDFFDGTFAYKYKTRLGKIITGSFIANNYNYNVSVIDFMTGVEFPFLRSFQSTFTSYLRMSSEGGGAGNGTSYHRFSLSHIFHFSMGYTLNY